MGKKEFKRVADPELFERIGDRMRKRRESVGWTQEYVAERMEVSRAQVSHWESGRYRIPLDRLYAWCSILGTTIAEATRR